MRIGIPIIALTLLGGAAPAVAGDDTPGHHGGMDHPAQGAAGSAQGAGLSEPGQGAFAALAETVRLLEADPGTDWSRVDLAALRAHLVDMDRLVTQAVAAVDLLPNGLHAVATGDPDTMAALSRMVPAHAAQLARDDRWTVTAQETATAMTLRVTSEEPAVVARIQGLGFFGLMASQDHHRDHHLLIARGSGDHAH